MSTDREDTQKQKKKRGWGHKVYICKKQMKHTAGAVRSQNELFNLLGCCAEPCLCQSLLAHILLDKNPLKRPPGKNVTKNIRIKRLNLLTDLFSEKSVPV